ncbi:MAG: hypothetical protein WD883_00465 [Candidatus Colwellbacteria bacterium]
MNGDINTPRPRQADTKFWFEIAAVLIFIAIGGWIYFGGGFSERSGVGSDLNDVVCDILPQEHCRTGVPITYLDKDALAFNLPDGTPIYMPFDGAFFDESPEGLQFVSIAVAVPGTDARVIMVFKHSPYYETGVFVEEGKQIAEVEIEEGFGFIDDETNSNFVLYTENYPPEEGQL